MVEDEIIASYDARRARHTTMCDLAATASRHIGWARLGVFLATAIASYLVWQQNSAKGVTIGVVVAGLLGFSALVVLNRRYRAAEERERALAIECAHGIARIRRDWDRLPKSATPGAATGHAFAEDLDVFGRVSLASLVGRTGALTGAPVMREWLLADTPPDVAALRERQAAVAELAPGTEWRESLAVLATKAGTSRDELDQFLEWAEESRDTIPPAVIWLARALTVVGIALGTRMLLHHETWRPFVLVAAVNLAFTAAWSARASRELAAISSRKFDWAAMSRMLEHLAARQFVAPLLRHLSDRADPEGAGALRVLDALGRCGEVRYSPMGHAALQLVTLWDFHVVAALAQWRRAHGVALRGRLRALGEIEALAALGTLAFENPGWSYPRFVDESTTIDATEMAHPLLAASVRVGNDVTVGPRGTFLLVTGSNMAGKSTLLRTVGLNVILAHLGAPVCATSLSLPRVRVRTVIHVRDSIASGTSLFLAEVLRVREVVAAARDATAPLLLYLADEILHGTNAEDRRIAIRAILSNLLESGSIGVLATHLVGLQNEPALAAHARPVHFTEFYDRTPTGLVMRFDYRLRPGAATSRNALRLLESIGLHTPSGSS